MLVMTKYCLCSYLRKFKLLHTILFFYCSYLSSCAQKSVHLSLCCSGCVHTKKQPYLQYSTSQYCSLQVHRKEDTFVFLFYLTIKSCFSSLVSMGLNIEQMFLIRKDPIIYVPCRISEVISTVYSKSSQA